MGPPIAAPPRPPLRILVVDDSPEDRLIYRRLLAKDSDQRYEFLETDSGADGLRQARAARPDCVLLDYRLPDLDGLEFLTALTAEAVALHQAAVPVIVLTGRGSE